LELLIFIQWYPSKKFENLCTSADGSFASLHSQGIIYHELLQVTDFSVQAFFFLRHWNKDLHVYLFSQPVAGGKVGWSGNWHNLTDTYTTVQPQKRLLSRDIPPR